MGALTQRSIREIRTALSKTIREVERKPLDARGWTRPATATLDEGLRFRVKSPSGTTVETDMPRRDGGKGESPSPGWYFRAGTAACVGTVVAMRAAMQGISLDRLEVTVESEGDERGMLGTDDAVPAGYLGTVVRIRLGARGVPEDRLRELARWGEAHSPVSETISRAVPKKVEVEVLSPTHSLAPRPARRKRQSGPRPSGRRGRK